MKKELPVCFEVEKRCFAKRDGHCTILTNTDSNTICRFCKERAEITKGKYYPKIDYSK